MAQALVLEEGRLADFSGGEAENEPRGRRAVGVVYNPELEGLNDAPSILSYLDETRALHPLHSELEGQEPPLLYPWGF